jgi:hypothetical protein
MKQMNEYIKQEINLKNGIQQFTYHLKLQLILSYSLNPLLLGHLRVAIYTANLGHWPADRLLHTQIDTKLRGRNREEGLSMVGSTQIWAAFYRPKGREERG